MEVLEITIPQFIAKVKENYPKNEETILASLELAQKAHGDQRRASGQPYILHPVNTADILINLGMDSQSICAALLHDTVEDTEITDQDIREKFGEVVADLVKGVTKLDKITFNSLEDEQAENIRKMFFAMSKDIRVVIIKLADRLHNMRSLKYLSPARQITFAKESLEIFAPLAGRLGISPIKCELEDLALKHLEPDTYEYLSQNIALKRTERQDLVDNFITDVKNVLQDTGIDNYDISGRTKHFYSIYKKIKRGKTLELIFDMTAIRVIVETIKDCYAVLGAIHAKWKPIPGRFKDYIAVPKPNLYQSLHTTVYSDESAHSTPFEVQIRTYDMHKVAEYGVAAHWKYKEGVVGQDDLDQKLEWVKEVLKYESDLKDSTEFLDLIRNDISITDKVYVFTPKGDVMPLTSGATALDFAYAIHSAVGNKCVGTKVNAKIVPLNTVLNTGDIVEVMTNSNAKGPSRDWLKIVKTANAKAKIRQFFKHEMKDENIKTGKAMVEREIKRRNFSLSQLLTTEAIASVCERYMFSSEEDMYASVGYGGISMNQIITKLIAFSRLDEKVKLKEMARKKRVGASKENAIIIKGFDDLLVRFAHCCSPVPGDSIVGYVSRGRGVCVHRADCQTVKSMEKERVVPAEWVSLNTDATFPVTIEIKSEDKGDIFADITKAIANEGLPLVAINARKDRRGNAVATITIEISNHDQVSALITKLTSLPHVISAYRTSS